MLLRPLSGWLLSIMSCIILSSALMAIVSTPVAAFSPIASISGSRITRPSLSLLVLHNDVSPSLDGMKAIKVWCLVNDRTGSVKIEVGDDVSDLVRAILKSNPSLQTIDEFAVEIYPPGTDIANLEEGTQPLRPGLLCNSPEFPATTGSAPVVVKVPQPELVQRQQPAELSNAQLLEAANFTIPTQRVLSDDKLFAREETKKTVIKYLKDCQIKDEDAFDAVSKKFKLLGASGVMGIGKTQLMAQISTKWTREALGPSARAVYVSYNGGGKAGAYCQNIEVMPDDKIDSVGHLLLASYGVDEKVAIKIPISDAINYIRCKMDCANAPLVICIDEIVHLDKLNRDYRQNDDESGMTLAQEIMSGCMSLQDASDGQLIFIFTAILDSMYTGLKSSSGRAVLGLPLSMIPLQDVFDSLLSPTLLQLARTQPAVHQFVLSCAGHPRATVEGLARVSRDWTCTEQIISQELSDARRRIIDTCKFDVNYIDNDLIDQWFDTPITDELQNNLLEKGILHSVADDVKFIFPLLLQEWSDKNRLGNPYGHHISKLFYYDLMLDWNFEENMEAVMYHYEAILRLALKGQTFGLRDFYRSDHICPKIANKSLRAHLPSKKRSSLVAFVKNFSDMPLILDLLDDGLIVVSEARTEKGIEYLAPFKDKHDKLVVACVQCKFVKHQTSWPMIREKMAAAVAGLNKEKIQHFPVVYTTADLNYIQPENFQDGVHFVEKDLFAFTNRMGILRLHTQKLGKVLAVKYPFFKEI